MPLRTIDSLFGDPIGSTETNEIELAKIDPSPFQRRRQWSEESLVALAESIAQVGVNQPILVRPGKRGRYELVAGERRVRASRMAGKTTIPAVVRELNDSEVQRIALVENLQREDLNAIDRIDAVLSLCGLETDLTPEEVAAHLRGMDNDRRRGSNNVTGLPQTEKIVSTLEMLGINWMTFLSQLGALRWPEDVLEAVRAGDLDFGKGKLLARVEDDTQRASLIQRCIEEGISTRELAAMLKSPTPPPVTLARRLKGITVAKVQSLPEKKQARLETLLEEIAKLLGDE